MKSLLQFVKSSNKIHVTPNHVAFIMDGNGRWAGKKGLPRISGHQVGVDNIPRILTHLKKRGIKFVTIFAFSTENWNRPQDEIDRLMSLTVSSIAEQLDAKLIVAFTESGSTAARVASYRPSQSVIALSPDISAEINLGLRWGVNTVKVESFNEIEVMFDYANDVVKEMSLASTGDSIVVVAGLPIGVKGNTNLIRVITIS